MEKVLEDIELGYSLYAVVAFLFALVYIAAICLVLFVPQDMFALSVRDYISGILWALKYFGVPVLLFVSTFGIIYARTGAKKGVGLSIFAIISAVSYLGVLWWAWPIAFR